MWLTWLEVFNCMTEPNQARLRPQKCEMQARTERYGAEAAEQKRFWSPFPSQHLPQYCSCCRLWLQINEWDLCWILPLLIFALTVFLQPRCQDLSLGFCPLEPQPKSEGRNPSRVVDVLSKMFRYYFHSYAPKCTCVDVHSVLITFYSLWRRANARNVSFLNLARW